MAINNVCFDKCHELGMPLCRRCKTFHPGAAFTTTKEKPATHPNDKSNPNTPVASA